MATASTYSVAQHIALKRVGALAASPCGRWLAVVVQRLDLEGAKYVSDLWRVPTDGGAAVQLTRGESKETAPCFRRDGALGFLSNRRPNELKPDEEAEKRMQVWLLPADSGEPRQITDEPLGVDAFAFAARADRMVLLAPVLPQVPFEQQRETATKQAKNGPSARHFVRQPVRHWDHWLHQNADRANVHVIACDENGRGRVDLTPQATREFAIEPELAVSDDGRHAAVTRRTTGKDRVDDVSIVLFDLGASSSRVLAHADATAFSTLRFSPDGRTLAASREMRSPKGVRATLSVIDVASAAMHDVATAWDRWGEPGTFSADSRRLFVTADDHGDVPVFVVDLGNHTVERLTSAASGGAHNQLALLADSRIACVRSTLLDPPECYVLDAHPGSAPHPLARLSGHTPAGDWVEVERITVPSTDGVPIQSLITKPKGAKGKLPTLFWIHGGPVGMSTDGWHWRWNPLLAVAAGYAVVQPNPRGSTGYGQKFVDGIWGNTWGAQCFEDLMAVADALVKRPDIDASRVMAMGGSFGGYMTNWIGTQTDRFKCLITHASIVGMSTFTGVTDHPGWWYLEMGGENPYANPESFDRYSPWKFITRWKSPTLIIHGELDYRCPVSEGLMLFEALQYQGVPSELLIFPDENHWILKPNNIAAWYTHVLDFVRKHMG
ncbi:MAG TPA: S9 family peptidase [Burkholderiaceae bacterium]|nr:S9 family peptidase [Burkholderiaceae bacterium]